MDISYNIYLELDTLLDTRLGTLIDLSPSLAARVVKKGYYKRKTNNFEFISSKIFNNFYKERSKRTILDPKPTSMIEVILTYILDLRMFIRDNDPFKTITVFINTSPYIFSSIEKENMLNSFKIKFPPTVNIELIDIDSITIDWIIKNKISTILKYDGLEWLEEKYKDGTIIKNPIPRTILTVPDLKENNKSTDKEIELFMLGVSKVIQLEFTDIGMWSSIDSIYKN